MLYKIKLKNDDDHLILDDYVYEVLKNDIYLSKLDFLNNIRKHSTGCAVYQKAWGRPDGTYKVETIYLHKYIAEKWLGHLRTDEKNLVGAINGDKLDCRVENLMFRSKAVMSRQRRSRSATGFNGVSKDGNRYRAVIAVDRKHHHIGMYETAEEAALAYNKKSIELFGDNAKINIVKTQVAKIKPAATIKLKSSLGEKGKSE